MQRLSAMAGWAVGVDEARAQVACAEDLDLGPAAAGRPSCRQAGNQLAAAELGGLSAAARTSSM